MNRFLRRYPSPSLVISITALVVSLGGAGYSATGGNFILGNSNSASTPTLLQGPIATRTLQVNNGSTTAGATALSLSVVAGHPPMKVNSSTKVANLNADKLDGLDSAQFPRKLVIPFNLAPGGISAAITLPQGQPIFLMGVTTTQASRSVGHATLLRAPGIEPYISWVGLESVGVSPKEITVGQIGITGAHIVYLDYHHTLDLEVGNAANGTIRIHNENASTRAGVVTLLW